MVYLQKKVKLLCSWSVVKWLVMLEWPAVMETNWARDGNQAERDDDENFGGDL
jgi:hypothetical protein